MQALDARDAPLLPKGLRVVSSTHRDLEAECAAGRFRRDLWERLRGVALVVPPLRARGAEVEALASWFLWESCFRSRRRRVPGLSSEVLAALRAWPWPGNLRELRSVIEHAALRCAGDAVALEHLPDALRAPPPEFSAPSTIL
jgi:DNA-binding NtrC family response regulator